MTRAKVFHWIKRRGTVSRADVVKHFRITPQAATNYLVRLRADGAIQKIGYSRRAVWYVVNQDADVSDGRGLHPNCLKNLRLDRKKKTRFSNRPAKDWPKAPDLCRCWA